MIANKMVCCANCLQWFTYNPANPWGIVVKKRGYNDRYYCGECISNNKITAKARKTNEHIKSKENIKKE